MSQCKKKRAGHQNLLPLGALMMAGLAPLSSQVLADEAKPAKVKELAPVNVQADADKPDGARATTTRVGKVLQDPHDVPQAVTTVTKSIMEQQQVGSLKEALRNVSGLSFNAAEGGRSGDNMNLRGFYTFGDMYLDGIRDTAQYNRETFNLEQIDVLRGAGAMLFGRGQAGGVINQVSKTPMSRDQYKVTGSLGNHDYKEVTADLNKVINEHTALRLNAMQRDEGSWRSNPVTGSEPDIHRQGAAFSLGLNLNTDNQFWINHAWVETNDNPDYGVPFDSATRKPTTLFSPGTFWGTDATFDKSDTSITTLVNEYRISPQSQLRTQLRVADYERSYWARTPSNTTAPNDKAYVAGNNGPSGGPTRVADYETVTLQSDFSTKVQAIGMKHELLLGLEYLNENSYRTGLLNVGGTTAGTPPSYRPYMAATTGTPNVFHADSYALYAQDTVEFIPKWKATLGIRRDELHAEYNSANSPHLKFGENSYRSALSYHPSDDTHYYVGWSDSFSPTADLYQLTTIPQPPERSDVFELGAKWMLMDGDLALRAAAYQATKDWERNNDLESTTAPILTKKRRTRGIELEAAGRISDDWEVFAGLALMNAKILEVAENYNTSGVLVTANPAYAGKRARNTPEYTVNLWSTYQVNYQWKLGGGVEAKGDRQATNPSGTGAVPTLNGEYYPNTAPSYVRWDAMVEFSPTNKWLYRLNVKNLFDKVYYDAVYDNGAFTVPGPRRTVVLSAEYKF